MIKNQLKVGDYIFTANGDLARITKINKQTYSFNYITGYGSDNVPFNGIRGSSYLYDSKEWFECDDIQAKALEAAFKRYKVSESLKNDVEVAKELIGKAKFFLEQVNDIETVEVNDE